MFNQRNPPIQKKKQLCEEKYAKDISNRIIYNSLNLLKLVQNLIKIITPLFHFESHPQPLLSSVDQKYTVKVC